MCKRREALSLRVLIGRGLDQVGSEADGYKRSLLYFPLSSFILFFPLLLCFPTFSLFSFEGVGLAAFMRLGFRLL